MRDLPESAAEVPKEIKGKSWGRLGVDTDGEFTPYYVVPADKKKYVQLLKTALKDASEVILATDPDREGESISWHLKQVLKPKVRVRRIVFHEITEDAINEALREAHEDVDENLVRAQESRRILDRLYGYTLSPVLWKKVQTGLSAGRVQSVAVRLIVEREEERMAFRTASYWDLEARIRADEREFTATLVRLGDQRIASGKDFDAKGELTGKGVRVLDEAQAHGLVETLSRNLPWAVTNVEEKPFTQRPAPPFTTSTLQQDANRKFGFSAERTMQVAQRLFQGVDIGGGDLEGLISYHRTDSTTLSDKALREAGQAVTEMYGGDYYKGPRQYQTKVRNAQEAHEAIRPTEFRRTPQTLERVLEPDELKIYDLIWKRAIASQMAEARMLRTTVEITGHGPTGGDAGARRRAARPSSLPATFRAYVEGSDDPAAELDEQETLLPKMAVGEQIYRARQHRRAPRRRRRRPQGPSDDSAAALYRSVAGQATRRRGHRTTVHLRADRRDDSAARLRVAAGQGARPELHGVCRDASAARAFRRLRGHRLHRGDGGDSRPDLQRREGLARLHPRVLSRRRQASRARESGRGQGAGDRLSGDRRVRRSRDQVCPIRVRIGRYGPFLQVGESSSEGPRASVPNDLAPADLTCEKARRAAQGEGARVRDRSATIPKPVSRST